MKKIIFTIALTALLTGINAQSFTADFESFTLAANSAYSPTTSTPFQTTNAIFRYSWDTQFSYWSGGFAYTNKLDSINTGLGNLYGVRAYKGYNSSNKWVIGQDKGIIKMIAPYNQVDGFYITNTTYAWKSMKSGDQFAKKFGGPSGNDPDFFKVTVKAYAGSNLKPDSVVFFLADFTFTNNAQDYIVNTWQYVNTSTLGYADSLKFFLYSSDMSGNFINTPAYFAIDNFGSTAIAGLHERNGDNEGRIFPNPFQSFLNFDLKEKMQIRIRDISGRTVFTDELEEKQSVDLDFLQKGIYFAELDNGKNIVVKKLIRE